MPKRIQRKRTAGWRMPPNATYVGRPGQFGNYAALRMGLPRTGQSAANAFALWVENEASDAWKAEVVRVLRGRDIACWCKPGQPCHGDTLLRLANAPAQSPQGSAE